MRGPWWPADFLLSVWIEWTGVDGAEGVPGTNCDAKRGGKRLIVGDDDVQDCWNAGVQVAVAAARSGRDLYLILGRKSDPIGGARFHPVSERRLLRCYRFYALRDPDGAFYVYIGKVIDGSVYIGHLNTNHRVSRLAVHIVQRDYSLRLCLCLIRLRLVVLGHGVDDPGEEPGQDGGHGAERHSISKEDHP